MGLYIKTNSDIMPTISSRKNNNLSRKITFHENNLAGLFYPPRRITVLKAPLINTVGYYTHELTHLVHYTDKLRGEDYFLPDPSFILPIELNQEQRDFYYSLLYGGKDVHIENVPFAQLVGNSVLLHHTQKKIDLREIKCSSSMPREIVTQKDRVELPIRSELDLLRREIWPVIMQMTAILGVANYYGLDLTYQLMPETAHPVYQVANNFTAFLLEYPNPGDFYIPTEHDDPDDAAQSLEVLFKATNHRPEMIRYFLSN